MLKGGTEHVDVAKDHSVKEVAESAGVWKRTVIRVYQQWLKSRSPGSSLQNCARKGIHQIWTQLTNSLLQEWLHSDVAYIQKLVQTVPNPVAAGIGADGGITCYYDTIGSHESEGWCPTLHADDGPQKWWEEAVNHEKWREDIKSHERQREDITGGHMAGMLQALQWNRKMGLLPVFMPPVPPVFWPMISRHCVSFCGCPEGFPYLPRHLQIILGSRENNFHYPEITSWKPHNIESSERVQLSGTYNVRKGKLQLPVNRWSRRQVILCGTCLMVSSVKASHVGKMHILPLIGGKVEEVKKHSHCLAFSSAGPQSQTYYISFDSFTEHLRWHRHAAKYGAGIFYESSPVLVCKDHLEKESSAQRGAQTRGELSPEGSSAQRGAQPRGELSPEGSSAQRGAQTTVELRPEESSSSNRGIQHSYPGIPI
ncbi:hypothetical protein NFI96_003548 [Prochilodus magdalenae]|nr:hypothetical protein NFI96_003548 [Prochilodus magdalenae]